MQRRYISLSDMDWALLLRAVSRPVGGDTMMWVGNNKIARPSTLPRFTGQSPGRRMSGGFTGSLTKG